MHRRYQATLVRGSPIARLCMCLPIQAAERQRDEEKKRLEAERRWQAELEEQRRRLEEEERQRQASEEAARKCVVRMGTRARLALTFVVAHRALRAARGVFTAQAARRARAPTRGGGRTGATRAG